MRRLEFEPQHKTAIKDELENIFGRCITSYRDCIDLSDDIYRKTQKQLNPNTLRRIFGLVKAEYPPSQSTLTILSSYCGFYSVEELITTKQRVNESEVDGQEQLLNYIITLFIETPVKDLSDKTFLTLVKHTICLVNNSPILADKFMKFVAKRKSGQDFYFEHFVNVDKLNSYYGNAIRYYLHEKGTKEAITFAHSLFTFKYWLNGNREKVLSRGDHLLRLNYSPFSAAPCILSRYFAALLFYSEVASANAEEILIDIYKYYSSLELNTNREQLLCFEYIIGEALILTGYYQDALHYLGNFRKNFMKSEYSNFIINVNNLKLLEALANYQTGRYETAENIFDEIKTSDFNFLNKQFSNILYLLLMNKLKRKNDKSMETKRKLVEHTGFVRLNNLLD